MSPEAYQLVTLLIALLAVATAMGSLRFAQRQREEKTIERLASLKAEQKETFVRLDKLEDK